MSTDKLKVIKNIKGVDAYSKNPIIDSLIKQKLSAEMRSVKDNFQQFIKQAQTKKRPQSHIRPIKKRTQSVQELAMLNPDRIRNSLTYNPSIPTESTLNFIAQRQSSSPFYQNEQIQDLNKARTDSENFFVRLRQSDKVGLESLQNSDPQFYKTLQTKAKDKLPNNLWAPDLPEVNQVIQNRADRISNSITKNGSQLFNFEVTDRPSSEGLSPLRSSRKKTVGDQVIPNQEITYDFKKYHKSDYQSLEKWLEIAVNFINQEVSKQEKEGEAEPKEHLNQIYTIYICALKQLIRLTYIQSAQKGLILQKLIWSTIRLFEELIREQHRLNYNDFKYFSGELKEQRQMYRDRMEKLEKKLQEAESQLKILKKEKRKIVLTGVTYKKVNQQMNAQLSILINEIRNLKKQNNYLNSNMLKMIHQFEHKQVIKIQKTEKHNIYFYLNQNDQKQVVAKVPKNQIIQDYFQEEMKKNVLTDQTYEGVNKNIGKLQNVLSNYWEKKKTYLDLDGIVRDHFEWSTQEIGCQIDGRGPQEFDDKGFQFPEEQKQSFEKYLKRQLTQERENWEKKEKQYVSTQVSLKDLYNQLKQTIQNLSSRNATLKSSVSQKDFEIDFQNKKLQQLQQRLTLFTKKITMLEETIEKDAEKEKQLQKEIEKLNDKVGQAHKNFLFEKENCKILANNLYEIKEKNQALQGKFDQLEDKIKSVAPYLEKVMTLPEASQHLTLIDLTTAVEKHLSEYVQKDAKVFLTF